MKQAELKNLKVTKVLVRKNPPKSEDERTAGLFLEEKDAVLLEDLKEWLES